MTQNIQRIMVSKVTSFPFLLYSSSHVCEGAIPPKQPTSFFLPSTPAPGDNPSPRSQASELLALPQPSLPQVLPSIPDTAELAGALGLGVHTYVVPGDISGIQGVGTAWVIILTVSIINLTLRQYPLGYLPIIQTQYKSVCHTEISFQGGKTPLFIPRLMAGTRKLEWQDSPWVFLFLSFS